MPLALIVFNKKLEITINLFFVYIWLFNFDLISARFHNWESKSYKLKGFIPVQQVFLTSIRVLSAYPKTLSTWRSIASELVFLLSKTGIFTWHSHFSAWPRFCKVFTKDPYKVEEVKVLFYN